MSFTVVFTKKSIKALKNYQRGGKAHVLRSAEEVVQLLTAHDARALYVLHQRWKDHPLKGSKQGIRELHLGMDDLLLYTVDEVTRSIEIMDITNHEKLRKKK